MSATVIPDLNAEQTHELARFAGMVALLFVVPDGKAVACDDNGLPVFDQLRYRRDDRRVFLYAFDLLKLDAPGHEVFRHACQLGYEGIVSKRLGSPYHSGRSRHVQEQEPTASGGEVGSRRGLGQTEVAVSAQKLN